ncbi:glutamate racemase [soil metagenome]
MAPTHLGIVDWGVGGLGLVRLLDDARLAVPVTYWSDTGSVPYGLQRPEELADRLRWVVARLAERGCTEVVLACNAASTAVDRLADAAVPVEGIIASGIAATEATLAEHPGPCDPSVARVVGVVGGAGTIRSGRYRRGLAAPGRRVVSRVAQPLSAHIEAGRTATDAFAVDLRRIVAPLRGADVVVLACTHYPAASDSFAAALPGSVLVDPAAALARSLVARHAVAARLSLASTSPADDGLSARTFVTTGDPAAMRSAADAAWSHPLADISQV